MTTWFEVAGITFLVAASWFLGCWVGRQKKGWVFGVYGVGIFMVMLMGFQRLFGGAGLIPPFSWLLGGRVRYVVASVIIPLIFAPLLSLMPQRRFRIVTGGVAILMVTYYSVMPFVQSALARPTLQAITTQVDEQGVCLQQTDYTCGPAAAVTALKLLGLPAEEGRIAIWSLTSPTAGTSMDVLADALKEHYGEQGLNVNVRHFRNVSDLKKCGLTLAVIKCEFLLDHYVAVLTVSDRLVVVGDPSTGISIYSPEQFAKVWRFSGIELSRTQPS
jgi:predicted double-glycine peptidase